MTYEVVAEQYAHLQAKVNWLTFELEQAKQERDSFVCLMSIVGHQEDDGNE